MRTITLLTTLALALAACHKKADAPKAAPLPVKPVDETPIEAQQSKAGLLDVKVELRDDGFLLHIGGLPAGATLECDLDEKALVPCHDGALFARPTDGDHRVHALAVGAGGAKLAFGDSPTFTVAPGSGGALDAQNEARNPLNLEVADAAFKNGMTVPLSQDFVAHFKLSATTAPACKVALKCSYDSRTSQFWTACDAGANSFTVGKDLLASGLQYLSAQASCGDQLGPILTIFFYGVPDGYQPLMLRDVKDSAGRHIFNLVKADDCPTSQQSFECSEDAADPFTKCVNGNVVDAPAAGYRVRLVCDGRIGPVLSLP